MGYLLAIDQGTTSTRAIIFDQNLKPIVQAQEEFPQIFPKPGWVEHDAMEIWASVAATSRAAIEKLGTHHGQIAAIGITNQRETCVVWNRKTGRPIYNAIVWQDRRTADFCNQLRNHNNEAMVQERTGLLLDPYFSATKIKWILDHVEGARAQAEAGELAFGTIDSWLIWNLTGGKSHVTDATNASRSQLYNINLNQWDADLCALFDVPMAMLPTVLDCSAEYGVSRSDLFGAEIPILGVAGDQQAAAIGQACFNPGMIKSTYGTGCFALLNTGPNRITSQHRLLSTIAYRLSGQTTYALEGSIFIAGAVVQWLRDGLGIIRHASETQSLAERSDPEQDVILVPAFTGLGAPYWKAECRGAIYGLSRNSGPHELSRAALESVGYQTRDLLEAMHADWQDVSQNQAILRVDGGMSTSDWTMQFLADIIGAPIDRPQITETTALGAAYLAGLGAGLCPSPDAFGQQWALETRFFPQMSHELRQTRYQRWKRAIEATITMG